MPKSPPFPLPESASRRQVLSSLIEDLAQQALRPADYAALRNAVEQLCEMRHSQLHAWVGTRGRVYRVEPLLDGNGMRVSWDGCGLELDAMLCQALRQILLTAAWLGEPLTPTATSPTAPTRPRRQKPSPLAPAEACPG